MPSAHAHARPHRAGARRDRRLCALTKGFDQHPMRFRQRDRSHLVFALLTGKGYTAFFHARIKLSAIVLGSFGSAIYEAKVHLHFFKEVSRLQSAQLRRGAPVQLLPVEAGDTDRKPASIGRRRLPRRGAGIFASQSYEP